jgi:periplasmic divalent cation tolerance protein
MPDPDAEQLCEVVITAPDAGWLLEFCRTLVQDRLAAAAHQVERITCVYRWEGAVHLTGEARCMIRTRRSLVPAIVDRTHEQHQYELPSVVAFPIVAANPGYVAWVLENTVPGS